MVRSGNAPALLSAASCLIALIALLGGFVLSSFFAFLLGGTAWFSVALAFDTAWSSEIVMDVNSAVFRPPCIGVSSAQRPVNTDGPLNPLRGVQAWENMMMSVVLHLCISMPKPRYVIGTS